MIKHVGYPKCVCGKPFTLVQSPAEERAWNQKNPKTDKAEEAKAIKAK